MASIITHTCSRQVGMNYTEYRCLEESNFDVVDDEPSWTQSSSPWSTPRECWWPVDSEDERLCTSASGSGKHKCEQDSRYMNVSEFRWCGSNYDALGNARFTGGVIEGEEWDAQRLAANATYVASLNWGYTTFDNIFVAFLSIFQSITMEGWSNILYQVRAWLWVAVVAVGLAKQQQSASVNYRILRSRDDEPSSTHHNVKNVRV